MDDSSTLSAFAASVLTRRLRAGPRVLRNEEGLACALAPPRKEAFPGAWRGRAQLKLATPRGVVTTPIELGMRLPHLTVADGIRGNRGVANRILA